MNDRTCRDCGDPISGRRRRCDECKRLAHAKAERERYHRGVDPADSPMDQVVVDYTQGGHKPSSTFDVQPKSAPKVSEPEVVDYTKGGASHPGAYVPRLDYSQVPASVRQDRVKAARMAAQHAQAQDSGAMDWDSSLQALQQQADSNIVDFSHMSLRGDRPEYTITRPDVAGQLYPTQPISRPKPGRSGQHVPHII